MTSDFLQEHLHNWRWASPVLFLTLSLILSACAAPMQLPNHLTTQLPDQVLDHHTIVQVAQIGHFDYNAVQS